MSIDIAAMTDAQKLAFAQAVGLVKIAGGAVANVSHLDLALPSGYSSFELSLDDWLPNSPTSIAMCFSADGGVTFFNDTTNFDTYCLGATTNQIATTGAASGAFSSQGADAALGFGVGNTLAGLPVKTNARLTINCGSADTVPSMSCIQWASIGGTPAAVQWEANYGYGNPAATVPFPVGAVNLLRLFPYGTGSCTVIGGLITGGNYRLIGNA
jgi:hypothetical protein